MKHAMAALILLAGLAIVRAQDEPALLGLDPFFIAYYIAEVTNGILMDPCPQGMFLGEGAVCVQVWGTTLSTAELLNEIAVWEWSRPWSVLGGRVARRVVTDDESLWFVIQDGYTVLKPSQPGRLPLTTFDGVLIGVYFLPAD